MGSVLNEDRPAPPAAQGVREAAPLLASGVRGGDPVAQVGAAVAGPATGVFKSYFTRQHLFRYKCTIVHARSRICCCLSLLLLLLTLVGLLYLAGCRKRDLIVPTKTSFYLTPNGFILVPAYINDKGPVQLILDTGELGGVLLSPGRAGDLGIRTTGSQQSMGAAGPVVGRVAHPFGRGV